jgi:hypothetical protein
VVNKENVVGFQYSEKQQKSARSFLAHNKVYFEEIHNAGPGTFFLDGN